MKITVLRTRDLHMKLTSFMEWLGLELIVVNIEDKAMYQAMIGGIDLGIHTGKTPQLALDELAKAMMRTGTAMLDGKQIRFPRTIELDGHELDDVEF